MTRTRSLLQVILLASLLGCDAAPSEAPSKPPTPPPTPQPAPTPAKPSPPKPPASGEGEAAGIGYLVRYSGQASPQDELPMVIGIHGLGDRPSRFGLLTGYQRPARVILPRGLEPHGGGFSWFPIRVRGADPERVSEGMRAASKQLAAMITALVDRYPTTGKPVVTGFSQGGMLSFALAVEHPQLIAAALPVAGWLPEPMWPKAKPESAPPIIALHGDADPVLPIEPTRDGVGALRRVGWDARLTEYPGVPHRVRPNMLRELYRQLETVAASR